MKKFICTALLSLFVFSSLLIPGINSHHVKAFSSSKPYVDVYMASIYDSVNGNNMFAVNASKYQVEYDLTKGSISGLYIKGTSIDSTNVLDNATTGGMPLQIIDSNNKLYSTVYSTEKAKMKIIRGGEVCWQVVVENIKLKASDGTLAPCTATETFWFWAEKFYVTVDFVMTGNMSINLAEICSYYNSTRFNKYNNSGSGDTNITDSIMIDSTTPNSVDGIVLFNSNTPVKGSLSHIYPNVTGTEEIVLLKGGYGGGGIKTTVIQRLYSTNSHGGSPTTWTSGSRHKAYFNVFPDGTNTSASGVADIQVENDPLSPSELYINESSSGKATSEGYDNMSGCYNINIPTEINNAYYKNPNVYETAKFTISNDGKARQIRVHTYKDPAPRHTTSGGTAVLTDGNENPTGIYLQLSNKWDLGGFFWDTFSSLDVPANTTRTYKNKQIFGNWGNHQAVGQHQLDLTTYDSYGQLWIQDSIGMSEITCWDFDLPFRPNICDFRPMNGVPINNYDIADNNPWFINLGGSEFCYYVDNSGVKHKPKRKNDGIEFVRNGPNITELNSVLYTDNNNIKVTINKKFFPGTDKTRSFYTVRYDFNASMTLNDAKKQLRLFNILDADYAAYTFSKIAYLASDGSIQDRTIYHAANGYEFIGMPMSTNKPWACYYNTNGAALGFVIRNQGGLLAGKNVANYSLALTSEAYSTGGWDPITSAAGGKNWLYVVPGSSFGNTVNAGDYITMDIDFTTYKTPSTGNGYDPMVSERTAFGTGAPSVIMHSGTKISDFPTVISLSGGAAEFTVTGGSNYIPIEIRGFSSIVNPVLEELINGCWVKLDQSVIGKDYWQTEYNYSTGKYDVIFLFKTDGGAHRFKASNTTNLYTYTATQAKDAVIITENFPFQMLKADSKTVQVTVKNTGTEAWRGDEPTSPENHQWGLGGTIFGIGIWYPLDYTDVIQPGQTKTFTINLDLYKPSTAGIYNNTSIRMIKNYYGWVGNTVNKEIRVFGYKNREASYTHNIPTAMTAGQQANVSITAYNYGNSAWVGSVANDKYGLNGNKEFLSNNVWRPLGISETIAPGSSKTFNFTITAPSTPGRYLMYYNMQDKSVPVDFGDVLEFYIQVN